MKRTLIFSSLTLLVLGWWFAAALPWRAEMVSKDVLAGKVPNDPLPMAPLSTTPSRYAALRLLAVYSAEYAQMDKHLARSIELRPMYAPFWLDRAETAFRVGDKDAAGQYLDKAVALWPNRSRLLWKAAMLYARLENPQAALGVFKRYLANHPGDYARVLAVSGRLEPDAAALLHAIMPGEYKDDAERGNLLWAMLRTARSWNDENLGRAAWRILPVEARRDPDKVGFYVDWMVANNDADKALSAWRYFRPGEPPDGVDNAGFEDPPMGGLGWRVLEHDDVGISRDKANPNSGAHSLKVQFAGSGNINFNNIRKYLPVEAGGLYRLAFHWRGEGITTRSGPFIHLAAAPGAGIAKTEGKWGSWDWQEQAIEFTVPADTRFVELSVRRNKTDALDNKIKGTLWLDDFQLTSLRTGGQRD